MNIEKITLFEQDAEAKMISDKLNKVWIGCGGRFESLIQDIQVMDHALHPADLIINTSTEHFYDDRWWGRVPSGRRVVLQGTDQKDSSHVAGFANLTEFKNRFELREMEFVGSMDFNFTDKSYQRFMLIGRK